MSFYEYKTTIPAGECHPRYGNQQSGGEELFGAYQPECYPAQFRSVQPGKVECMMFLGLNRLFLPEVRDLHDDANASKRAVAAKIPEQVARVQAAVEGTEIELVL